MTRRLMRVHTAEQNRWYLEQYTYVGIIAVRKLKVANSNPTVGPIFHLFLDTS